ncbi:MAG: methionyl-tRNA formyltransferase [Elusimicrobia bacterium]|nr:methionyl-tRNA formyltransferase [Elusimicrobiota bacterium]
MGRRIDTVFFSGSRTGCSYLDSLARNENINLRLAVTGPDKPAGRGRKIKKNPVAEYCADNGIACVQSADINLPESADMLGKLDAEIAVVVDYGQIFSGRILGLFRSGAYNIHYSVLPDLRGPAPVRWALMKGYRQTGVTLMVINEKIDHGGMISRKVLDVGDEDDYGSLKEKLTREGVILIEELIGKLSAGEEIGIEAQQEASEYAYASKIAKSMTRIDWAEPAASVVNRIRALSPEPGAYTRMGREKVRIKIFSARMSGEAVPGRPGEIIRAGKDRFSVAAGDSAVDILLVQPPGKRVMKAGEFMAGHKVETGEMLS